MATNPTSINIGAAAENDAAAGETNCNQQIDSETNNEPALHGPQKIVQGRENASERSES